jgi:hypothetical protein
MRGLLTANLWATATPGLMLGGAFIAAPLWSWTHHR